jgi:hypothetical protein
MAFTLETLSEFDQTIFDRGAGWAIMSEIHLAIMTRAKACGHSALTSAYATQLSGLLWLEEGYATARPELRSKIATLYNGIEQLVSGQTGLRWTEASGRSAEWTMASLTADIGMGDFDDLLVKPQRPEPLVWLVAALNRLRYPKITVNKVLSIDPVGETASRTVNGSAGALDTPESVWDELAAKPMDYGNYSSNQVRWRASYIGLGSYYYDEIYSAGGITHTVVPQRSVLATKANDYLLFAQRSWYDGPDVEVIVGSSEPTSIMAASFLSPTITVESVDADIQISSADQVSISIATELPDSVPFDGYFPGAELGYGYILAEVRQIVFYCDLPDVLGAGELNAPVPIVAGDNE